MASYGVDELFFSCQHHSEVRCVNKALAIFWNLEHKTVALMAIVSGCKSLMK